MFIGLNNANSSFLNNLILKKDLARSKLIEYNVTAGNSEARYAEWLREMGISLHPGTVYPPESINSASSLKHCESLVYRTLKSLPQDNVSGLKNLTFSFNRDGRRGLGGGGTIILRCQGMEEKELVAVFVHEMGHVTDTGVMNGSPASGNSAFVDGNKPVYNDDPSVEFYSIDFNSNSEIKSEASELDFVSGYAMTDPFEDFAESYAYYVLHGDEFRELIKSNVALRKKYDYLKTQVFNGKEYFNGAGKVNTNVRQYDVTVLPYDLQKFFVI